MMYPKVNLSWFPLFQRTKAYCISNELFMRNDTYDPAAFAELQRPLLI
jgi:hypothetical protein